MNHDFLIKTRSLSQEIETISETHTKEFDLLKFQFLREIEQAVLTNSNIGKTYLISSLNEVIAEAPYFGLKFRIRLLKLQNKGLNEYDSVYADTKQTVLIFDEAITEMLVLLNRYFPEEKDLAKDFSKLYSKSDITSRPLEQELARENYYNDSRSNEEIFVSKIYPNPLSSRKFESLDQLVDSMRNQANAECDIYRSKIETEIETFPTMLADIIKRELSDLQKDFKTIVHGNLITDSVLRQPSKFLVSFKELALIINHLDSEELTGICRLTIKRLALLQKIDFLNSYQNPNSSEKLKISIIRNKNTNTSELMERLSKTGFFNLEKIKCLNQSQQYLLCEKIEKGELKYQIAMLDFLAFLRLLANVSIAERGRRIADLLNRNDDTVERTIGGLNGNVAHRYNSAKLCDAVKKDYEQLLIKKA